MKFTKMTPAVQLDQVLDIRVDASKRKLNVYWELGDEAVDDEWSSFAHGRRPGTLATASATLECQEPT